MNLESRKYVLIIIFVFVGILYTFKLFFMQVVDDSWKLRAQQVAERRREITPPRAVVFDRTGKKVVANKTYYNLMMREDDIEDLDTVAFGELIGWSVPEIREGFKEVIRKAGVSRSNVTGKIESNYRPYRRYPFIKELTAEENAKIAAHLDNFPGFYTEATDMRFYPFPNAANVLGYLAEVNQKEIDNDNFYSAGSRIGRSGIERSYEKEFRGKKGVHYIITSALLNDVDKYEDGKYDTTAVQAPPITLGLDIELQAYGEKLLQGKRGCIVAIEPSTGEILALVSSPNYDPNLLVGNRKINENYPALVNDKSKPLFPRPLASEYMPGSTFKLLQSLIGMQEGVINENTGFPCNKSVVGCHNHPSAQNISQAVQMSCNPYYYAVVRKIIQQRKSNNPNTDSEIGLNIWAKYMHSFGLGKRFDTDIPGTRSGVIPDSKYYDKWYGHHQWKFSTIRSISIGQGEVQLTPLQMANVAAIFANRGFYYTPHFVKSIGDKGPLKRFKEKHQTMVEGKYFTPVIEGMRRVVYEPGGTARRARLDSIIVCGKTGTIENYIGSVKQPNHSAFIAFAPMNNPKIAISVFIENAGGGGGSWAAPIASLMIEKYINRVVRKTEREKRILEAKFQYPE